MKVSQTQTQRERDRHAFNFVGLQEQTGCYAAERCEKRIGEREG